MLIECLVSQFAEFDDHAIGFERGVPALFAMVYAAVVGMVMSGWLGPLTALLRTRRLMYLGSLSCAI